MSESFGQRIKRKRKVKGLSQETLAAFVGVTCGTIRRWERSLCIPHNHESVELMVDMLPTDLELHGTTAVARGYAHITFAKYIITSERARELSEQRVCGFLTAALRTLDEAIEHLRLHIATRDGTEFKIASLLADAHEDDLRALTMYFRDGIVIPQIAKTLGWGRARASRAIKRALGRPDLNLRSLKR